MDLNKLCYGCFREYDGVGPCPHCGFDRSTSKHPYIALPIGTILNGRYLTGRVLGVGGFGITYLAYDMTLEICVAVKEYLPSGIAIRDADHYTMTVSSDEEQDKYNNGATRFLDEARILAKLRKLPNIVSVHDYFRENNTAYFVMEYIEGQDLMKYTNARGGKLPFNEALTLLLPIMKSLDAVHKQNLLHRDISPDNIIVTNDGSTRLLDFGAARLAIDNDKSKSIILKHGFAPEEQYRKHGNQGPWSDEYALAATMYLILTGIMPPDAIERVHEDSLVAPIDLGVDIPQYANDALMQALSVHASGRFPDMKSFAYAISGKGQPQVSAPAAPAPAPLAATPATAPGFAPSQAPAQVSAPIQTPAPAQAPIPAPSPVRAAGTPAAPSSPAPVSAPATSPKKSIWKRPLTYIVAGIVLLAGISIPLGLYFSGNLGSDKEETTTKKTKKTTTTTTEEPTTTTEPTTESTTEATTTESTTPATTTTSKDSLLQNDPQHLTPIDLGDGTSLHFVEDLSFIIPNSWYTQENNGVYYYFPVSGSSENFMMVYSDYELDPDQAANYDFTLFVDTFIDSFTSSGNFQNVNIPSREENMVSLLNYADLVMTAQNKGVDVELYIRVILDKSTGYAYSSLILLDANGDSATKEEYKNVYLASVGSMHLTMPQEQSSDEFISHFDSSEYVISQSVDDNASEAWTIYKLEGSDVVLFSYFRYDSEQMAIAVYDATYQELLDAYNADQFAGYLHQTDWKITCEGAFAEGSSMGEGYYRFITVRAGNTLIACTTNSDGKGRIDLAKLMHELGL